MGKPARHRETQDSCARHQDSSRALIEGYMSDEYNGISASNRVFRSVYTLDRILGLQGSWC